MDEGNSVELVVLAVKETAARCRPLGGVQAVTLRSSDIWKVVPGEIAVVAPRKQWSYAMHPYLSGDITQVRFDVAALALVPLRLHGQGEQEFEMEQVIPGSTADDDFDNPITQATDLLDVGDHIGARKILMDACQADLRCLDAHAHLGNLEFGHSPARALRHYEVGVRIGGLSLGDEFDGLLPWHHLDNRPFLRCMHGFGLCLWRLGRLDEAARVFECILRLNPMDNQGVRFVADDVRGKRSWEECRKAEVGTVN